MTWQDVYADYHEQDDPESPFDCPKCGADVYESAGMDGIYHCQKCNTTSEYTVCPVCNVEFLVPMFTKPVCPGCEWTPAL